MQIAVRTLGIAVRAGVDISDSAHQLATVSNKKSASLSHSRFPEYGDMFDRDQPQGALALHPSPHLSIRTLRRREDEPDKICRGKMPMTGGTDYGGASS